MDTLTISVVLLWLAVIALGVMLWALSRGSIYAACFLIVMLGLGSVRQAPILLSGWSIVAFPAAVLVSASFSAMALCVTSFVKKVEQFDIVMGLGVMPMFLFSGIFFPVTGLPPALVWVFHLVPLFHGVELLRAFTTGQLDWVVAWHVSYLVVVGAAAFAVAMSRLERALVK